MSEGMGMSNCSMLALSHTRGVDRARDRAQDRRERYHSLEGPRACRGERGAPPQKRGGLPVREVVEGRLLKGPVTPRLPRCQIYQPAPPPLVALPKRGHIENSQVPSIYIQEA
jgi:hypothetical protein